MNDSENTKPLQGGENAPKQRAVPARPAPKKDPRRARKSSASDELSRRRVQKARTAETPAAPKKTVTAVSEVRKNADPEVLKRSEAKVSRPADKRVKKPVPQQTLSKKTIEQRHEKKIMSGILAALDENEKTAPAAPKQAAVSRHSAPVRAAQQAPAARKSPAEPVSRYAAPVSPRNNADPAPKRAQARRQEPEYTEENAVNDTSEENNVERINRNISRANAVICTAVLFGVGLALIFGPRKSGCINSENRIVAEKPV